MYHYDLSISPTDVFEDELEGSDIPDNSTVSHSNVSDIFKLEDPKLFKLCAQSPTIPIFYEKLSGIVDGSYLYVR